MVMVGREEKNEDTLKCSETRWLCALDAAATQSVSMMCQVTGGIDREMAAHSDKT
jgi:hypothetical protein